MTHGRNNDTPALNASQHWAAGREPCRGEIPVERSRRRLDLLYNFLIDNTEKLPNRNGGNDGKKERRNKICCRPASQRQQNTKGLIKKSDYTRNY